MLQPCSLHLQGNLFIDLIPEVYLGSFLLSSFPRLVISLTLLKFTLPDIAHLGGLEVLSGLGLLELRPYDVSGRVKRLIAIVQSFFAHGGFSRHHDLTFHEVRRLRIYCSY